MTAHRSDVLTSAGRHPRAHLLTLVVAMLLLGAGGLARAAPGTPAASPSASPVASAAAPPVAPQQSEPNIIVGHVTIELTDSGFVPSHFESAVGRNVTINLVNNGTRPHNFTLPAFDIDIDLAPGEKDSVYIPQPALGKYPYTSSAPGDEDFSGTMVVFI